MNVRTRLTLLYAAVFAVGTGLVLLGSYLLVSRHLHRTLPNALADDTVDRLAGQYALALVGLLMLAVALGWWAAGRALAPLRSITETAQRVSHDSLDERIALTGPHDEVRELADTVDAMLDRLERVVDAQRRFIANASHELRSPLTVIRTEADITLSDPNASVEDLREMGRVVLEATDRTDALLDALMLLARSQEALLRRDPVDLHVCAQRAVQAVSAEAEQRRVHVRVQGAPAPLVGDAALLDRLAGNLVENAVRHNVPGGVADVETVPLAGGGARLTVVNDGPVVPSDALNRLAEPFERLDRASSGPGTGLGLSIVRAVAETHGGRLHFVARPEGGLQVTVEIPGR